MATHSSILAWRIPWTEEHSGSQRARHHWVTNTFTFFPQYRNRPLNGLSTKSSLHLGISIPSTMGQVVMKCLPNHGQIYDHERDLPTKIHHVPCGSIRIRSSLLYLRTFNTPWKEFRAEIRNEAFCALGRTGRTGLQKVKIFSGENFINLIFGIFSNLCVPFSQCLTPRKALKSFMKTYAPMMNSNLLPKYVPDCMS